MIVLKHGCKFFVQDDCLIEKWGLCPLPLNLGRLVTVLTNKV